MNKLVEITPSYVYVEIPAEYVCVYHKILKLMAKYGESMIVDCKASQTTCNIEIIECFNMFNAAIAAKKLGKESLANTLIKYINTKLKNSYKETLDEASFILPIDADGKLKIFVTCGTPDDYPKFEINPDDGKLYQVTTGRDIGLELSDNDYSK